MRGKLPLFASRWRGFGDWFCSWQLFRSDRTKTCKMLRNLGESSERWCDAAGWRLVAPTSTDRSHLDHKYRHFAFRWHVWWTCFKHNLVKLWPTQSSKEKYCKCSLCSRVTEHVEDNSNINMLEKDRKSLRNASYHMEEDIHRTLLHTHLMITHSTH